MEKAKKAAEAKAAAETAVTAHVEAAHQGEAINTQWDKKADKVNATLVFDGSGKGIDSFNFGTSGATELTLEVKKVDSIPDKLFVTPPIKADDLELAFWVESYKADNSKIGQGASTVVMVKDLKSYHDIQVATMEALESTTSLNSGSEVKYLKLKGFVRKSGSAAVFAVPGELRIDLTVEKTKL